MRCYYCPADAIGNNVRRTEFSTDLIPACGEHADRVQFFAMPTSIASFPGPDV